MKNINKYFLIFLVVSIGLIPFLPSLRSIDMSAPHYLYLSFTQLLISIYLILIKKEDLIKLNFIDISYIIFLFFSLVSFFKSINLTESIVEFSQFLTLFITYFNLKILLKDLPKKQHIFLTFFTVLATIESLVILSVFIENYAIINLLLIYYE